MGSIVAIQGVLMDQKFVIKGAGDMNPYHNLVTTNTNFQISPLPPVQTKPIKKPLVLAGTVIGPTNPAPNNNGSGSNNPPTTNPVPPSNNGGSGGSNPGGDLPGGNWENNSPQDPDPFTGSGWDNIGTGGGGFGPSMDGLPGGGDGNTEYKVLGMTGGCPIYGYDPKTGAPLFGRDSNGNVITDPKVLPCYVAAKGDSAAPLSPKSDKTFKLVAGFIIATAIGVAIFKK